MSERFFHIINKECIWHYNFTSLKEANKHIYSPTSSNNMIYEMYHYLQKYLKMTSLLFFFTICCNYHNS